jgi:hypothetical protein
VDYSRKKSGWSRQTKLDHLPVKTIHYELPEEEQVCICCGGALTTEYAEKLQAHYVSLDWTYDVPDVAATELDIKKYDGYSPIRFRMCCCM